ncbi:MAG: phosphoribosylglycinamide formyltransferase [Candidatus Omnitrophica bacterium]|nr:phosphoribosylglycinamide formyltransferase [Candidatus Omnitrophota bacterium]
MNIAVFVSGNGSNLQAIIDAKKNNIITSDIKVVVSNNANAFALERAKKEGIKTVVFDGKVFHSQEEHDLSIISQLKEEGIDLVVLAGYMRILTDLFIGAYTDKIINVHPSLLPSFKGAKAIKESFEYGVKTTGVTVHFVDKELDGGPIILQKTLDVEDSSIEQLEERIHKIEHALLPQAIALIEQKRISITGRKVKII